MLDEFPVMQMLVYPSRELPMSDMRTMMAGVVIEVTRIDDYVSTGCLEEHTHVTLKYTVFHQMEDDIQRQREVCCISIVFTHEPKRLVLI
jgi:hypothetical protein